MYLVQFLLLSAILFCIGVYGVLARFAFLFQMAFAIVYAGVLEFAMCSAFFTRGAPFL